ncbi:MAG: DciA family protein [Planctomycetota bacterium]
MQRGGGKRRTGPEGLGDILKREIRPKVRRRRRDEDRARHKWTAVIGDELASRTAVVSFRRKVLRVQVDSSALLAELDGIYKKELISALAEGEDPVMVRTIEFQLAGASG